MFSVQFNLLWISAINERLAKRFCGRIPLVISFLDGILKCVLGVNRFCTIGLDEIIEEFDCKADDERIRSKFILPKGGSLFVELSIEHITDLLDLNER